MTLIAAVCLDDRSGMQFNHRRQSRDRLLVENFLQLCSGHVLWMNARSRPLFQNADTSHSELRVDEAFLEKAGAGDYCFVENLPLAGYAGELEGLVIYRWNRAYPGDLFFDLPLSEWQLQETAEFPGSSHEKITREIYVRPTRGGQEGQES